MPSKQYVPEFWTPFEIQVGDQKVTCNLGTDSDVAEDASLCIIPTQARNVVEDPAGTTEKPNVMTQWLDMLTDAGARILLFHGHWFDKLSVLVDMAREGGDGFALWQQRLDGVVAEALRRGYATPGRVVLMGSSRHGFAVLHGGSNNKDVSAIVAWGPVTYWPRLKEFAGMEGNPVVQANDIFGWADRYPPRPMLIQTGYDDDRVGSDLHLRLAALLTEAYFDAGAVDKFTHHVVNIPGHSLGPKPDIAFDYPLAWLRRNGYL